MLGLSAAQGEQRVEDLLRRLQDLAGSLVGLLELDQARGFLVEIHAGTVGARLIQYQQGYQAAAKVLQVAQSVFDTLLSVGAR